MDEKKKKMDKALGQDPFEDMEGMSWDEPQAAAEVETEAEPVELALPAPGKAEGSEAEGSATPKEAESALKVEGGDVTGPVAGPSSDLSTDGEDDGEGDEVAEPDEEAFDLLEELIATINQEVEETFGPGAMTDLATEAPVGASGEEQHVIFGLAGTEYAAPIANVTEIGRPLEVTPVPNVPDWVLGVANLRGDIISAVDMRTFLGMEAVGYRQASRMMVAQARQGDMSTGLVVDRVSGIRYLSVDQIGAPTAPIEDQVAPYLQGVYEDDGQLLVVLDFDRLLLSPEMQQFQPV